jgi:hypothetical protein
MDVKIVLVVLPLVALLAVFIGYMGHKLTIARTLGDAETRAKRILDDGRRAVEQARADAETKLRRGPGAHPDGRERGQIDRAQGAE